MANLRMGYIGKSFSLGILGIVGTLVACGGGGITSTVAQAVASPYVLLASTYTPHASASGDLKWSTAEGGDVFMGSGGNYAYGGYGIFGQNDIDYHQSIGIQFNHTAALAPTDFIYTKIQTPLNQGMDISQSAKLKIQMGNGVDIGANSNTATVFTVEISGGAYNAQSYSYANTCSMNVTLNTTGTANNLRVYSLPLTSFGSCTGTLAALKADLKAVTVKVLAVNDTNAASTANNLVLPKVGLVAFSL
jgi:hypothetical protein